MIYNEKYERMQRSELNALQLERLKNSVKYM